VEVLARGRRIDCGERNLGHHHPCSE